ncbi:MAG: thioredoxin family protein [Bacteroidia bacterium]|nr:thioredoxin family protein [Bacteroidia bacterium]
MNAILIIVFMVFSVSIFAQEYNHKQMDTKSKSEILIGLCNTKAFAEAPFSEWFNREAEDYKPDLDIVKQLKQFAGKYQVTVVMATWCSDSRREVPRFFKVMNMVGYSPNTIKIISVDSDKIAGELDISGLKLEKVPTFVITISGKEIGRIVETPEKTIETDLYNILKNNK